MPVNFLNITLEPFKLRIVFAEGYLQYAQLENVQAMIDGLFPGSNILVEQVDEYSFFATRQN